MVRTILGSRPLPPPLFQFIFGHPLLPPLQQRRPPALLARTPPSNPLAPHPPPLSPHPQVFGLLPAAEITHNQKSALDILSTILAVQPKETGKSGAQTPEQVVGGICADLLTKIGEGFKETTVKDLIRLQGPQPLTIFLRQELHRMQHVIDKASPPPPALFPTSDVVVGTLHTSRSWETLCRLTLERPTTIGQPCPPLDPPAPQTKVTIVSDTQRLRSTSDDSRFSTDVSDTRRVKYTRVREGRDN